MLGFDKYYFNELSRISSRYSDGDQTRPNSLNQDKDVLLKKYHFHGVIEVDSIIKISLLWFIKLISIL